jgi:hypothetical protein
MAAPKTTFPTKTAPEATEVAHVGPAAQAGGQGATVQDLKVTGYLMTLPPGLFCVVNEPFPGAARMGGLPGVRLSPPPGDTDNVELSGFRADGWLTGEGDAALVRIKNRPTPILVTIYQAANLADASPRLQVRQLLGDAAQPEAAAAAPAGTAPAPAPVTVPAENADLFAHIQTRGDVGATFGDWLGERGSKNWIEGFSVNAPEGIDPADLSYQAVLGRGWLSPWVEAGQYCGSRGMALPLLGLRVRLSGEAAEQYEVSVEASFVGGAQAGPVGNDETCEADTLAPLEALRVMVTPRGARKPKKR